MVQVTVRAARRANAPWHRLNAPLVLALSPQAVAAVHPRGTGSVIHLATPVNTWIRVKVEQDFNTVVYLVGQAAKATR